MDAYRPLETGLHVLCALRDQARAANAPLLDGRPMFAKIAGTVRLQGMLDAGAAAGEIIASWQTDITRFRMLRAPHLLY